MIIYHQSIQVPTLTNSEIISETNTQIGNKNNHNIRFIEVPSQQYFPDYGRVGPTVMCHFPSLSGPMWTSGQEVRTSSPH